MGSTEKQHQETQPRQKEQEFENVHCLLKVLRLGFVKMFYEIGIGCGIIIGLRLLFSLISNWPAAPLPKRKRPINSWNTRE